ncbi:hypothetical protein GCM10025734_57190 [Kitasatospora paranensis]
MPGLVELMGDLESRAVRLVEVTTAEPSPFARSLLFGYVAQFLYEGDSPLAERRAAALSLDSRLLSELLGQAELRELLDPQVLAELEAELQRLTPERRIKDAEGVADALRLLGPLTEAELSARGAEPLWALELEAARRAIRVRIGGEQRWAAIEDAGRLRDALGTPCRWASRRPSPSRSRTRWATCWPATPAPTARSSRPRPPAGSAWAPPSSSAPCTG